MSQYKFMLQIVYPDGLAARFPGGGAIETALIDAFVKTLQGKNIGLFRTQTASVTTAAEALIETLTALKEETLKLV